MSDRQMRGSKLVLCTYEFVATFVRVTVKYRSERYDLCMKPGRLGTIHQVPGTFQFPFSYTPSRRPRVCESLYLHVAQLHHARKHGRALLYLAVAVEPVPLLCIIIRSQSSPLTWIYNPARNPTIVGFEVRCDYRRALFFDSLARRKVDFYRGGRTST